MGIGRQDWLTVIDEEMAQYAIPKLPFLLYDGTNSSNILAMVQDDGSQWSIQSETGGVLTLFFAGLSETHQINEGEIALADTEGGASSVSSIPLVPFETRWLRIGA